MQNLKGSILLSTLKIFIGVRLHSKESLWKNHDVWDFFYWKELILTISKSALIDLANIPIVRDEIISSIKAISDIFSGCSLEMLSLFLKSNKLCVTDLNKDCCNRRIPGISGFCLRFVLH